MQPGYGYGYGAPQGYAPAPGYGMPPQQPAYGYGVPGGGPPRPPRTENTAEDLDRIARTIHVGGIRGLRGTPGVNPGEEITEDDLAAFFGNDGEVVGDEQVRRIGFSLKAFEQVDDLALGGDVKRRDRLVEDEQFRRGREGPCDRDPLPLPTGELIGIPI